MKKSEFIERVSPFLFACKMSTFGDCRIEAKYLLDILEEIGMTPPFKTVKVVEDEQRPGMVKHTETERGWDEEE